MTNDIETKTTIEQPTQPLTRGHNGVFPRVTHPAAFSPNTVVPNPITPRTSVSSVHEEFSLRYTTTASTRRYDPTPSKSAYTTGDPSPLLVKVAIGIAVGTLLGATSTLMAFSHTSSVVPPLPNITTLH